MEFHILLSKFLENKNKLHQAFYQGQRKGKWRDASSPFFWWAFSAQNPPPQAVFPPMVDTIFLTSFQGKQAAWTSGRRF